MGEGERLELRRAGRRGFRSGEGWCIMGASGAGIDGVSGTERSLGSRSRLGRSPEGPARSGGGFSGTDSRLSIWLAGGGALGRKSILLGSCLAWCSLFCFATPSTMLIKLSSPFDMFCRGGYPAFDNTFLWPLLASISAFVGELLLASSETVRL